MIGTAMAPPFLRPRISRGNSDSYCVCIASRRDRRNLYSSLELLRYRIYKASKHWFQKTLNSISEIPRIQYCYFHLSQSVWLYNQSTGNTNNYKLDKEFHEHVRRLLSTAFLPVNDVSTGRKHALSKQSSQSSTTLMTITLVDSQRQIEHVKTPDSTLTAAVKTPDSKITGRLRTNSAVDCWNSQFVKLVNTNHPSFPRLIENSKTNRKTPKSWSKKRKAGKECHVVKKTTLPNLTKSFQISCGLRPMMQSNRLFQIQLFPRNCQTKLNPFWKR